LDELTPRRGAKRNTAQVPNATIANTTNSVPQPKIGADIAPQLFEIGITMIAKTSTVIR
jgi:hypothetical protein